MLWNDELRNLVLDTAVDVTAIIKNGLKYCAFCGKQTWHAVSVWPDPTQCPYCEECCRKVLEAEGGD